MQSIPKKPQNNLKQQQKTRGDCTGCKVESKSHHYSVQDHLLFTTFLELSLTETRRANRVSLEARHQQLCVFLSLHLLRLFGRKMKRRSTAKLQQRLVDWETWRTEGHTEQTGHRRRKSPNITWMMPRFRDSTNGLPGSRSQPLVCLVPTSEPEPGFPTIPPGSYNKPWT